MSKLTAFRNLHNEGGEGYNPEEAKDVIAARAAADARIESLLPRFAELRAAWNAAVAKYAANGQISATVLAKIETEVGVTRLEMLALKARAA